MMDRRTFGKALGASSGAAAVSLTGLPGLPAANASAAPAVPAVPPAVPRDAAHPQGTGAGAGAAPASFGPLKHVRAGVLDTGYAELGPADGPVVICLHGWPYDIHSFEEVAPRLAAHGYRVVVPFLRGHGTTRFLSPHTVRNAQQSAVALDIVSLMDALRIGSAVLAGFDWGSRTADIIAALWPGRCTALVSVSGYLITDLEANLAPLPPRAEYAWWYQYYFATERGRTAMADKDTRRDLGRLVWDTVSPTWDFDDAVFARTAAAFDNPDYGAIVVHNYRWRLSLAGGERRYDHFERQLAARPKIAVPTVTLDAELDPFTASYDGSGYREMFTGPYDHRELKGIGHNVPQEAPAAFAQAVLDAARLAGR